MENTAADFIGTLLTFLITGPITFFVLLKPHKIIRFQAKFYKSQYKTQAKLTNEEIDSRLQLPWDRFLMGKRSEFIERASENPEEYKRMLNAYRAIGFLMLIPFLCALILFVIVSL